MELKVKDVSTGVIYSSDSSRSNKFKIKEIYFNELYTTVYVENEDESEKTLILPPFPEVSSNVFTGYPATKNGNIGEWV